jgi:ABC-2 type transport system ATP-binding protein
MQLTIRNVSKTYPGGVRALKDVSLDIGPGMFGLMGPNGAGKSTLMRIVATLQAADAGAVSFDETDTLKDKAGIRKRLGYLPQDFGLYPDVSAERMLDHIAFLKGMIERKERRASVQAMLERTNLADDKKRKLGTFSGGMIQRFGIAQALIADPDLLVVDEPTAGLDPEERNRFLNVLSETSENKIVVLSTHIVDDVRVLCPRMAVIHEGRILFSGDTTDALGALRNKLWRKTIGKDELARYDEAYEVVLTRMVSGRMEIHVAGGRPPEEGFEPIEPDLEDAYFRIVKGSRNESGR